MQRFTGKQYLKIDAASSFGLDKEDWDTRLAWFDDNAHQLDALLEQAEEPALFYAGCQAWKKAEAGLASGYPVSLDAVASGLQLLSCLIGCETSAKLCGVVDTGHRADAYTLLYERMQARTGLAAALTRKQVKQAIMTGFYNSTAVPRDTFGEGPLLDAFYETMEQDAPGAWELNQAMLKLWQPYADSHDWVMPDNFHVHVPVESVQSSLVTFLGEFHTVSKRTVKGTKEGRSLGPNLVHSVDGMIVREMQRRCQYSVETATRVMQALNGKGRSTDRKADRMVMLLWDHYLKSGFLSARILDSLDRHNMGLIDPMPVALLLKSMPQKPFEIMTIHDCFRCLPNYGNDLRQQYNNLLAEIAGSDLLAFLVSQIAGKPILVNKKGDISGKIRDANYALS